jgi:hypothetical protein
MSTTAVSAYRVLLRLYPRRFRDEYGPDMALLFADQLRDEPVSRVWVRSLVDLAVTVPQQHLETHMNRPPSPLVPMLFAGIGFAGVWMAAIGGSSPPVLAMALTCAVIAGGLAVAAWRNVRPLVSGQLATAQWWKFLAGGAAVLSVVIVIATAAGEVPEALWLPMMAIIVCALTLLGTGLALGAAHRRVTHRRVAPS